MEEQADGTAAYTNSPAEPITERFYCEFCPSTHKGFISKQKLKTHLDKSNCIKNGLLCMRCLTVWATPSEFSRHQKSTNKCKYYDEVTLKRNNKTGKMEVVIQINYADIDAEAKADAEKAKQTESEE